jgi:hypothetical protein
MIHAIPHAGNPAPARKERGFGLPADAADPILTLSKRFSQPTESQMDASYRVRRSLEEEELMTS